MKAMIFAAGLGTRLKPITDTIPKALVPIDGKPLLYRVVSKLKAAGISDFVINVHHFADSIIAEWRRATQSMSREGRETPQLSIAGSLRLWDVFLQEGWLHTPCAGHVRTSPSGPRPGSPKP